MTPSALNKISRDPLLLHPTIREAVEEMLSQLNLEHIPFQLYEGYRSPARQSYLYQQGRTRPGNIITNAKPMESYHQYGMAADLVPNINGKWSWEDRGDKVDWWVRMHDLAEMYGLEPISFEKPHVQLAGFSINQLIAGSLPGGGDAGWQDNFSREMAAWSDVTAAKGKRT